MTTYYLSLKAGQNPIVDNVAEATSGPTADLIVTIGSGTMPIANMSREWIAKGLTAIRSYVLGDDPRTGGAAVIATQEP